MKKTLSFMVMAFALLFAQCRKPEVKFPTPSAADEGTTVSMTVTAGPGSKTDITTAGAITWSTGDKLYVGDGSKYIGYLTLQGAGGSATGTFSGDVTLTGITEGTSQTFHFFYLGSVDYTGSLKKGESATVDVDFSSQNIYNNGGKLENASKHHVGYGSAKGTVKDGVVTGINVTLVSKVALARFSFTEAAGKGAYDGALILSGTNIYNKMKVNFSASGFDFTSVKDSNISLTGGHGERYVMLVPTGSTAEEILNFGGGATGATALENGIEANKFYGRESAIEVTVKPIEFTVDANDTKVKFSPGNLYWDGSAFRFEANQWDYRHYSGKTNDAAVIGGVSQTTPSGTVGSFFWSNTTDWQELGIDPYAESYSYGTRTTDDEFFTEASGFQVSGETANAWRTLSSAEWYYLLYTRTNASSLRAFVELEITETVSVRGLVILPDGSTVPPGSVTTTASVASSGAVFLPAAGSRGGTDVYNVGSNGAYWSSTPHEVIEDYAYNMFFFSGIVDTNGSDRSNGLSVRLVR